MFLGTYEYSVDSKGRLFIPAKLREGNETKGGKYILTKGLEGCLYLYDPEIFQTQILSRLQNLPVKNQQDARAFKRMLLAGASEVVLDEAGRVLVPKGLIDFAGFKKNVTILGVGQRIELWSSNKWGQYNKKAASAFARLGRDLDI